MSLEKVRKHLKEVKYNQDDCLFIPEHLVSLIMAIADHILTDESKETLTVPDGYVLASEFCKQQHWINQSTLNRYCNHNDDFATKCAFLKGKKWYVSPIKAWDYFHELSHWKPRLARYFK